MIKTVTHMVNPLIISGIAIAVSLIPYIESGLRISTLIVGFAYTSYKFYKEYKSKK